MKPIHANEDVVNADSRPEPEADSPGGRWRWVVVGCCILGAVIRLHALGAKSMWLDEAFSVQLVREPWTQFVESIRSNEVNMAAYYLVLRQWVRWGTDEGTVRLLSAILSVLTIPLVYALGARLFSRTVGAIAALLLVCDTGHVWAAQEARSYALAIFLVTASTWLLACAVDAAARDADHPTTGESGRRVGLWSLWLLYGVVSAAAVYAHVYAGLVLLGQWAALVATQRAVVPRRVLVASAMGLLVLLSPLAVRLLGGPHHQLDWIATPGHSPAADVLHKLLAPTSSLDLTTYVAMLVAGTIGLAPHLIAARHRRGAWASGLVLSTLFLPILIPLAVSLGVKPVLDGRFLGVCIPSLVVGVAVTAAALAPARRALLVAGIVGLQVAGLEEYYHRLPKEQWRDATALILDHAEARDVAIFYAPYAWVGYHYYRQQRRDTTAAPRPVFPRHAAPSDPADTATDLAGTLAHARRYAGRVWVTLSHLGGADSSCAAAIDSTLRPALPHVEQWSFREVTVLLYGNPGGGLAMRADPLAAPALARVRGACHEG